MTASTKRKRGRPRVEKTAGYFRQPLYDKVKTLRGGKKDTVDDLVTVLRICIEHGESWKAAKRAAALYFNMSVDAIRRRLKRLFGTESGRAFTTGFADALAPSRAARKFVAKHLTDAEVGAIDPNTPWAEIVGLARSRSKK
ncbi:MAG: hypothetical protein K1X64_18820 [Myxococcaceae bacterium]|nr:hypothetical protein [Myxococcaceae bacterium]